MRFWLEPREGDSRAPQVRGYVRSLRTGEHRMLRDPEDLARLIRGQLRVALERLESDSEDIGDLPG